MQKKFDANQVSALSRDFFSEVPSASPEELARQRDEIFGGSGVAQAPSWTQSVHPNETPLATATGGEYSDGDYYCPSSSDDARTLQETETVDGAGSERWFAGTYPAFSENEPPLASTSEATVANFLLPPSSQSSPKGSTGFGMRTLGSDIAYTTFSAAVGEAALGEDVRGSYEEASARGDECTIANLGDLNAGEYYASGGGSASTTVAGGTASDGDGVGSRCGSVSHMQLSSAVGSATATANWKLPAVTSLDMFGSDADLLCRGGGFLAEINDGDLWRKTGDGPPELSGFMGNTWTIKDTVSGLSEAADAECWKRLNEQLDSLQANVKGIVSRRSCRPAEVSRAVAAQDAVPTPQQQQEQQQQQQQQQQQLLLPPQQMVQQLLSPQQQLVSPQRQQSQPVGSQQVLAAAGSIGSTHTPGALGATAPQMVDASGHLQTRSYSTHRARGSVVQVQTSAPGVPLQQRYGAAPVYMQQHPGIPTGASTPSIQCDHETMRSDELLAAMLGVSQAGSAGSGGGFAEGLGVGSRFLPVAPTEPTAAASTATTVAAVPASSTPVPSGRSGAATFVVASSSAAVPVGPGRGSVPARGPVLLAGGATPGVPGQPPMTVRGQAAGPMVGGWQKVVGGSALAPAGLVRCSSPQVWSGARSPSQPLPPHLMQAQGTASPAPPGPQKQLSAHVGLRAPFQHALRSPRPS